MSKKGYISRYLLMIKKLKMKPYASYEELKQYMSDQLEYMQMQDDTLDVGFSKRTLQRDIRDIRNLFGVNIQYDRREKGYYISHAEGENMNFQRMMEAFDMFNSLNLSKDLSPFIQLEKRKPLGTENLYGLLHAIKNRLIIKFTYLKFWEEHPSHREVEPYALKEVKSRWYIMSKEVSGSEVKSFALDRLSSLEITNHHFQYPEGYDVEESFRYCLGIINGTDEPQDIILSFEPIQGKYVKTLPIHHTQEIIIDNNEELRLKLKLHLTHDLQMELLAFGDKMKVLEPPELVNQIKQAHIDAFKKY